MTLATVTGFSRKPPLIVLFSALYVLNPLGNILVTLLFGPTPAEQLPDYLYRAFFVRPQPLVIGIVLLWLAAPFVGFGLYRVRLWAWYAFVGHSILAFGSSLYQVSGTQIELTPAFWMNLCALVPLGYFIRREIRKPYFNPRMRWWERHPRLRDSITVTLRWDEYVFHERTFDLSPDGIFVGTENLADVAVGYFFNVKLEFAGGGGLPARTIEVQAITVWISFPGSESPTGFGLRFLGANAATRSYIGRYIRRGIRARKADARRTPGSAE